jgi:hypothetical protein
VILLARRAIHQTLAVPIKSLAKINSAPIIQIINALADQLSGSLAVC